MPEHAPEPKRNASPISEALRGVARNRTMIERSMFTGVFAPSAQYRKSITALGRTQIGGLGSVLADPKLRSAVTAIGRTQTSGLAARLADAKLASTAFDRTQIGGLSSIVSKHNTESISAAIDSMKRATDSYALTTPPASVGRARLDAARVSINEDYRREPLRTLPVVPNYTADLVALQRDAVERRKQERREELEHRRQSIAIQQAMYEALLASEAARSADSKASAEREQAALARADEAEAREVASAEAQAKQTRFMIKWTVAATIFGGVGSVAAVVAIFAT
jgi:hypothetical protein